MFTEQTWKIPNPIERRRSKHFFCGHRIIQYFHMLLCVAIRIMVIDGNCLYKVYSYWFLTRCSCSIRWTHLIIAKRVNENQYIFQWLKKTNLFIIREPRTSFDRWFSNKSNSLSSPSQIFVRTVPADAKNRCHQIEISTVLRLHLLSWQSNMPELKL